MQWNAAQITDLATAYWRSAALLAAVEVGLFEALAAPGPHDAAALAERCGTAERHTRALLDALCGMELLLRTDEGYAVAPDAQAWLAPDTPTSMLHALRYNVDLYSLWGRLGDAVREGAPVAPDTAHLGADAERTRRFVMGMHSRAQALAPAVVPTLPLDGVAHLLDVGSGPGTFSRAAADAHAALRVTQFDLPAVIATARELSAGAPSEGRIAFVAGDYRTDPLPAEVDAVLYCGALHQESPATAGALFERAARALRPGGRMIVVDMMVNHERTAPLFSALFGLNMLLTSPRAHMFSDTETMHLLERAGLRRPATTAVAHTPYWMVTAEKPTP